MKKPSAFRLYDLVLAIPAAIAIIAAGYFSAKAEPGTVTSAFILMWLVAATFTGLYTLVVIWRAQFLASFTLQTSSFFIDPATYVGDSIITEIQRTVIMYEKVVGGTDAAIASDAIYVKFHQGLFPPQTEFGMKRAGYIVAGGSIANVAYEKVDEPIASTALAHEIGHIILGRALGNWDCEMHHKFMQDNNLS
jgi:hypothetical protein